MIVNPEQTLLKTSVAGAGSATPGAARQTGSWMVELEKAFLAGQPGPDSHPQNGDDAETPPNPVASSLETNMPGGGALPQPREARSASGSLHNNAVDSAGSHAGKNIGVSSYAGNDPRESYAANVGTQMSAPSAAADGLATPKALQSDQVKALTPMKTPAALQKTVKAAAAKVEGVINTTGLNALPTAVAVAIGQPQGQALPQVMQASTHFETLAPVAVAATALQNQVLEPAGRPALPSMPTSAMSSKTAPSSIGLAQDDQEESGTGGHTASSSDAYPRNQLHLSRSDDGVQAWIRDTDLSQPQAYAVAQALRQELHQSGLRLTSMSLNGKKLNGSLLGQSGQVSEVSAFDRPQIGEAIRSVEGGMGAHHQHIENFGEN